MSTFGTIHEVGNLLMSIYSSLSTKQKITKQFDYYSLEYFSRAIFNALFDYELVNLNEIKENSPFIDLIDENNGVGIQVTAEKPNTKKLNRSTDAFDRYQITRLIIFFFSDSKANKIKSTKGEEIWTLTTIYDFVKKNPNVVPKLIEELKIWDNVSNLVPSDLEKIVAKNTNEIINEMKRLKKFDPKVFVPDYDDEKNSVMFSGNTYGRFVFESYRNLFYESSLGRFLCEHDENGSFNYYRNRNDYFETNVMELDEKKNAIFRAYYESEENKKKKDYFQMSNRSIHSIFNQILSANHAVNSSLMAIIRSAGQGKTVFCCNLVLNLLSNGITCFFITPVLTSSSNPYDEFKKQVERIGIGSNYLLNLKVLIKCMKCFNKPLLIVIDALNEYSNTKIAINSIGDIVNDIKRFGLEPKIVISSRNKKYEEFEPILRIYFKNIFCLNPSFVDNSGIKDAYFKKYGIALKTNNFLENLFKQSRLFIKLFCDIYGSKQIDFNEYNLLNLFDDYFTKRAEIDCRDNLFVDKEEFYETLYLVAKTMIDENDFNNIPLGKFKKADRMNIRKLADNDIFNISNIEGVNFVKFVFDEYRDYFLLHFFEKQSANDITNFFGSYGSGLDGLRRNIVLYRRKNKFDKTADLKCDWYFDGSIDVIINLPVEALDDIDKNVILLGIDNYKIKKNPYPYVLNKMIYLFVSCLNYGTLLSPSQLNSLNTNGMENLYHVLSNEYFVQSLFDEMGNFAFRVDYINEFIGLLITLKVTLNMTLKKKLTKIVCCNFNVETINELQSLSIDKQVIDFLEE